MSCASKLTRTPKLRITFLMMKIPRCQFQQLHKLLVSMPGAITPVTSLSVAALRIWSHKPPKTKKVSSMLRQPKHSRRLQILLRYA